MFIIHPDHPVFQKGSRRCDDVPVTLLGDLPERRYRGLPHTRVLAGWFINSVRVVRRIYRATYYRIIMV